LLFPPSDLNNQDAIFESSISDLRQSAQHGFDFNANPDSCTVDILDLDTSDVEINYYQFDSVRDTDTAHFQLGTYNQMAQVDLTGHEYDWNALLLSFALNNDQSTGQHSDSTTCSGDNVGKALVIDDASSIREIEPLHIDVPPMSYSCPSNQLFPISSADVFDFTSIFQDTASSVLGEFNYAIRPSPNLVSVDKTCKQEHLQMLRNEFRLWEAEISV